jgi:hypothetical protein
MYGLNANFMQGSKQVTARTRLAKIAAYTTLCRELGGSTYLWRQWCAIIASKYPDQWADAESVSYQHVKNLSAAIDTIKTLV